jgi:hypothetical protein
MYCRHCIWHADRRCPDEVSAFCGDYCTTRHDIQQFYVLPAQCIYVFCVDLRTNTNYFPIQH